MTIQTYARLVGLATALTLSGAVSATPIYDTFGPLDEATFGGTGIPNDEVAISSTFVNGTTEITVAMSATQRYSNPALTNDGAGTYFAQTGSNFGGAGQSVNEGALWNFNFYISIDSPSGETLADYGITMFYDFDPAADTPFGSLGTINITNGILGGSDPAATLVEGSENLLFSYLASDFPGLITAPGGSFDASALGEYTFGLQVSQGGWGVETVSMNVQTVPIPAAAWLFGSALLGLAGLKRRKLS